MSWNRSLLAGVIGAVAWVGAAQAQVQVPGWFGHIEGIWASTANGDLISSGNNVIGANLGTRPGPGSAITGRTGFRMPGPWDFAVGVFAADFKDGPHIGPPPANEWSIADAKVLSIDAEVGFNQAFAWGGIRPFAGLRYQQVTHTMRYHPDVPLNCCFNDTTGTGIGPRVGFDVAIPLGLGVPLSVIGGLDAALLFGDVTSVGGPSVASGSVNRTMYDLGARIGLDWEFMPLWHVALGYRADVSNGTFFTLEGFTSGGHPSPSGTGNRIV